MKKIIVIAILLSTILINSIAWAATAGFEADNQQINTLPYFIKEEVDSFPVAQGTTWYESTFRINYREQQVYLSQSDDGTGSTSVDDAIQINVTHEDGSFESFFHNYALACITVIPMTPQNISYLFEPGMNTVTVWLIDVCGGYANNSDLYLGVSDEATSKTWNNVEKLLVVFAEWVGLTSTELLVRINDWGPAWVLLVEGWKIYKLNEIAMMYDNDASRNSLIDERYDDECGTYFKYNVDAGVALTFPAEPTTWNDLTFEKKNTAWPNVCNSLGGRGFCSGYLYPKYIDAWLGLGLEGEPDSCFQE